MLKVILQLRLIIFFPSKGSYEIIYVRRDDNFCHWIKAFYGRGLSGQVYDSELTLSVKKSKDKPYNEFKAALLQLLQDLGFDDGKVFRVESKAGKSTPHIEFLRELFPVTQFDRVEFVDHTTALFCPDQFDLEA